MDAVKLAEHITDYLADDEQRLIRYSQKLQAVKCGNSKWFAKCKNGSIGAKNNNSQVNCCCNLLS